MHSRISLTLVLLLLSVVHFGLLAEQMSAQIPADPDLGGSVRSREDLEELLQFYEESLLSTAYSEEVKVELSVEASRVRARLRDGDFKLGDRIVLSVQGEPNIPDTVPVQAGPRISLPLFGDIPLQGVLRSEVEGHITRALMAYLRDPVVRAQGLMRVSVQGAVSRPGFYVVPADMLLTEAIMIAGGPTQTSNLDGMRIERGVEVMMEGDDVQEALRRGFSLDQLNMQAGDQLLLPQSSPGGFLTNIGVIVGLVASVTLIIIQVAG